ncbi:MAG: sulfotransferase domain-containing protein [Candidatus Sulfotelmatobacter sp.]
MSALTHLRARAARTRLRRPLASLRHLGLDHADVFLASYPRSGNTMLRFMLVEALTGLPSSFDQIQEIVPEIGVHVNARQVVPGGGRLIKTHEPYRGEYRRGIYIIRDVRDVMLSSFARESALDVLHIRSIDKYVLPFMQGKMTRFGSWQGHIDGWLNSPLAKNGDLLVVRFEEMRKDLAGTVARCLEFLGKKVDWDAIHNAVRNNSLNRMRAKEDRAKTLPKSPGKEGRWIGKGSVHGWREKLTERQVQIVDEYAGDMLVSLGYATTIGAQAAGR